MVREKVVLRMTIYNESIIIDWVLKNMKFGRLLVVESAQGLTVDEAAQKAAAIDARVFIHCDRLWAVNVATAPMFNDDGSASQGLEEQITRGMGRDSLDAAQITAISVSHSTPELRADLARAMREARGSEKLVPVDHPPVPPSSESHMTAVRAVGILKKRASDGPIEGLICPDDKTKHFQPHDEDPETCAGCGVSMTQHVISGVLKDELIAIGHNPGDGQTMSIGPPVDEVLSPKKSQDIPEKLVPPDDGPVAAELGTVSGEPAIQIVPGLGTEPPEGQDA